MALMFLCSSIPTQVASLRLTRCAAHLPPCVFAAWSSASAAAVAAAAHCASPRNAAGAPWMNRPVSGSQVTSLPSAIHRPHCLQKAWTRPPVGEDLAVRVDVRLTVGCSAHRGEERKKRGELFLHVRADFKRNDGDRCTAASLAVVIVFTCATRQLQ